MMFLADVACGRIVNAERMHEIKVVKIGEDFAVIGEMVSNGSDTPKSIVFLRGVSLDHAKEFLAATLHMLNGVK